MGAQTQKGKNTVSGGHEQDFCPGFAPEMRNFCGTSFLVHADSTGEQRPFIVWFPPPSPGTCRSVAANATSGRSWNCLVFVAHAHTHTHISHTSHITQTQSHTHMRVHVHMQRESIPIRFRTHLPLGPPLLQLWIWPTPPDPTMDLPLGPAQDSPLCGSPLDPAVHHALLSVSR